MAEKLHMGEKERLKGKGMEMVKAKNITLKQAAIKMGVCYRQAKRIYKGYVSEGDVGLLHKNLGKRSNKKIDETIKAQAIKLYEEKYFDFGPTLAAEK